MIIPLIQPYRTVILANGAFPRHIVPLSFLRDADRLICCDGAAEVSYRNGFEPQYIVGDLDSLSQEMRQRYCRILHHDPDQNTNDLTKAVNFCVENHWTDITILGATGKREDHGIGNIALLVNYAKKTGIQMITDYGVFMPMLRSARFESYAGQQVSVFSLTPETGFTFHGLKYPLAGEKISLWWQGTLNEACNNEFAVDMDHGKALIFREHQKQLFFE